MRGRITTEFTVWCGYKERCYEWLQEAASNKAQFLKAIRSIGWKRFGKVWHCPECAAKRKIEVSK